MWVIVKQYTNELGVKLPVIILNEHEEIWEFNKEDEAIKMKEIFQKNSDSKHEYVVKKI